MRTSKLNLRACGLALGLIVGAAALAAPPTEKVTFLGVAAAKVDDTLRDQLKLHRGAGLTVEEVVSDSPADKAGIKRHDVLEKLDDQLLFNLEQLTDLVRSHRPGEKVTLALIREGQPRTVEATLSEKEVAKPKGGAASWLLLKDYQDLFNELGGHELHARVLAPEAEPPEKPGPFLGVEARDTDASLTAQLGLEEGAGALVGHVVENSPAEKAGLREHDVIVKLDGEAVKGASDLVKRIQAHKQGDLVKIEVLRVGKPLQVEATLVVKEKPEPKRLKSIQKEYRIVPRVNVLPAPDGGTIIRLESTDESDEPNADAVRGEKRVVIRSQATGEAVVTPNRPDSRLPHKSAPPANRVSVVHIKWDNGAATVTEDNGKRSATVKDTAGKVVFEGPINTAKEKAKLPPEARKRVEQIEADLKVQEMPRHEIEEIKVMTPSREREFIRHHGFTPVLPVHCLV